MGESKAIHEHLTDERDRLLDQLEELSGPERLTSSMSNEGKTKEGRGRRIGVAPAIASLLIVCTVAGTLSQLLSGSPVYLKLAVEDFSQLKQQIEGATLSGS